MIDDQEKIALIILTLLLVAAAFATLSAALFGRASDKPTFTPAEEKGIGCWWIVIAAVFVIIIITMLPASNTIFLP